MLKEIQNNFAVHKNLLLPI